MQNWKVFSTKIRTQARSAQVFFELRSQSCRLKLTNYELAWVAVGKFQEETGIILGKIQGEWGQHHALFQVIVPRPSTLQNCTLKVLVRTR